MPRVSKLEGRTDRIGPILNGYQPEMNHQNDTFHHRQLLTNHIQK